MLAGAPGARFGATPLRPGSPRAVRHGGARRNPNQGPIRGAAFVARTPQRCVRIRGCAAGWWPPCTSPCSYVRRMKNNAPRMQGAALGKEWLPVMEVVNQLAQETKYLGVDEILHLRKCPQLAGANQQVRRCGLWCEQFSIDVSQLIIWRQVINRFFVRHTFDFTVSSISSLQHSRHWLTRSLSLTISSILIKPRGYLQRLLDGGVMTHTESISNKGVSQKNPECDSPLSAQLPMQQQLGLPTKRGTEGST